jgi:hypothetical protein
MRKGALADADNSFGRVGPVETKEAVARGTKDLSPTRRRSVKKP